MVNLNKLSGFIPGAVQAELLDVSTIYKINSPLRMAHFLAQCAHESAEFHTKVENLNYSADALLRVFGTKYFTPATANQYAHKPMEIASHVYANRMGNGDEASLEGWFYRGRGYLQLTGKDNYKELDAKVSDNLIIKPELVADKYPLLSAAWFWDRKDLNSFADVNDIEGITRRVNGGLNGLEDRHKYFDKYYVLLSAEDSNG